MSLFEDNTHITNIENTDNFLERIESYLKAFVAPLASEIDQSPDALNTALQGLIAHSLLSVRIPESCGGLELETENFYFFQQLLSRYSGALAFLQLQHQGAVKDIIHSENKALKQKYLSHIIEDKIIIGQGFSQLRRSGEPMLKAIAVNGGYNISGNIPWITGLGFFEAFILGAILSDGKELRGIIPFKESSQHTGGNIIFSNPMKLGVMQSTNTVSATLYDYFLPRENIVSIKEKGAIHKDDKKVVLYPSFLVLGCAKAGLDIVEKVAHIKQLDFIYEGFNHLNEELNHCQAKIQAAMTMNSSSFEDNLQLRVWAINLAQRCTKAAVTVSSGAANYDSHPAQRVYREALVFTVFAQTTEIMKATLEQLVYN
ncbi:MAG: acyl-CoA dehydrogenase family protein [Crocosphaera sp.]